MLAQAPGIGVAHMVDPTLYRGVELGEADRTVAIGRPAGAPAPGKVARVAALNPPVPFPTRLA